LRPRLASVGRGRTLHAVTRLSVLASRPLVVDAAIAVGLTLLSVVTVMAGAGDIGAVGGIALGFMLLETLPLAVRRLWPVPVWAVTLSATVGHFLVSTGSPSSIRATLGALIALFTVSERYERRQSVWALVITLISVGSIIVYRAGFPAGLGGLVQILVAVTVPWILGNWSRERRTYADLAEARAVTAERLRDEEARRAVAEERSRIARELHDVVTHHVSVMVIQADAAESALTRQPEEARTALTTIAATGRQALGDMRTMLGVLGPPTGTEPSLTPGVPEPAPGLDRLGDLLESVRAAGLPVELSVTGERQRLHPRIELSAYRIIQEALTNTLKHARGSKANVSLTFGSRVLDVTIADDGGRRASPSTSDGHGRGLIGMRERVAMLGGELRAEPTGEGFRVEARLPLAEVER
jgi:signal transduction histidine kinase